MVCPRICRLNPEYRTMRAGLTRIHAVVLFAVALTCCGVPGGQKEAARQRMAVTAAELTLVEETAKLQAMKDSLDIRIRQDVLLGMSTAEADSVERSVIASQVAVVRAAEENLKRQREYLEALEAMGD